MACAHQSSDLFKVIELKFRNDNIKSLKEKIADLEQSGDVADGYANLLTKKYPDDATILFFTKKYLAKAKQAYEEAGGK